MKEKFYVVCFIALFISIGTVKANTEEETGVKSMLGSWANAWGSKIVIESIDPATGKASGKYFFPKSTDETAAKITGWVSKAPKKEKKHNVIVFSLSAHWKAYGSITTYNGYLIETKDGGKLKTIYQMLKSNADYPFGHIGQESDEFTRLK